MVVWVEACALLDSVALEEANVVADCDGVAESGIEEGCDGVVETEHGVLETELGAESVV